MSCEKIRIALAQQRVSRDIDENVAVTREQVREAASGGARYIQTPECTNTLELDKQVLKASISTEADCKVLRQFRALAEECNVWLHIGSMTFNVADEKIANRSLLIAPDGSIAARYDKIHMFDVDLAGGESYRESRTYEPGAQATLAATPVGTLGLTICYDLRFPHLYRALAKAGAQMLTAPAAFTRQTGEAHWQVLQRARAIETGCFVLSAAQGGRHECGRETYGHSIVVDPWGEVLAEAGAEPAVLFAEIDLSAVEVARQRIPSLGHDRPFSIECLAQEHGSRRVAS